jgi:protocatechuate 3,4-dioxygenase, alpha subunit
MRTPSQTIGPFFAVAVPRPEERLVVPPGTAGAFWIRGRVTDGAGDPATDALIETWQADAEGGFARPREGDPGFRGLGRSATDAQGEYEIHTVKPGRVAGPRGEPQAPHIDVSIFARGLLTRLVTRIYFQDEAEANAIDSALAAISDAEARATLIASSTADGYRFDIRLQGDGETCFFDV